MATRRGRSRADDIVILEALRLRDAGLSAAEIACRIPLTESQVAGALIAVARDDRATPDHYTDEDGTMPLSWLFGAGAAR